jgi:hypothetical protein
MKQLLSISTAILMSTSLMAGAAFAQETGAGPPAEPSPEEPAWLSDEERALYERPDTIFGGFFTDETFTTLQEEDEFESTLATLAEEDHIALQQACEDVAANPAAYTEHTQGICIRAGLM